MKNTVYQDDIALMQDGKGWWLKVGEDWYCIINVMGKQESVPGPLPNSQDVFAAKKAKFYKPLFDILKEVPIGTSRGS